MDAQVQKIVFDKIKEKCAAGFAGGELTDDTDIHTLSMDSLTILEVLYDLEKHFDTTVDEHLLTSLRTVEDLVKMFDDSPDSPDSDDSTAKSAWVS